MEIDANVYHLLNVLMQVVLWSLIISAPAIILTVEMYAYERYKKWKDKSEKELERIIIGKTNNKEELESKISEHERTIRKLELDVELLEIRKNALNPDDEPDEQHEDDLDEQNEEKDLNDMSVKELHILARKHKLKWYSKMKKSKLIEALDPLVK